MTAAGVLTKSKWNALDVVVLLAIALAGALVSIFAQGFQFGIDNNVFHIPAVLHWYDDPHWATDAFTQSLRSFTSFVYPALGLVATRENIASVFFVAHVLSRWGAFVGALGIVRHLGKGEERQQSQLQLKDTEMGAHSLSAGATSYIQLAIVALVLAASPLLRHGSPLGHSGLFVDYFTHTEVAHGPALGSLLLAAEGFPLLAFLLNGLTFDINAFVGIWIGVALGVVELLRQRRAGRWEFGKFAMYGVANLVVALPAIVWILKTMSADKGAPFVFATYMREYFPFHFFIDSSVALDFVKFAAIVGGGYLVVRDFARTRPIWRDFYLVLVGIFLVGAVAPYISGNPIVFDLHLMRVDGILVILALVFAASASAERLTAVVGDRTSRGTAAGWLMLLFVEWPANSVGILASAIGKGSDDAASSAFTRRQLLLVVSLLAVVLGTLPMATQLGVGPTMRLPVVVIAFACFLVAVLSDAPLAAAASALIVSQGDPFLFAAACLYLGMVTLSAGRFPAPAKLQVVVAAAALAAMVAGYFVVNEHRAYAIAAALQLAIAIGFPVCRMVLQRISASLPLLPSNFAMLLVPLVGVVAVVDAHRLIRPMAPAIADWNAVTEWARASTPQESVFIVPYSLYRPVGFAFRSERRVWVDWKEGAAVMWAPKFHEQWATRRDEILTLDHVATTLTYACAHQVGYVVYDRRRKWSDAEQFDAARVYRTNTYDVFKVPSCR